MDGLDRLQKDIWAKASIVLLFVVAFLSLSAIFAQPADADLIDAVIDEAADVIDQAADVVETAVTPADEESDDAAPAEEIKVEVLPPVVEEVLEVVGDVPPVVEGVLDVVGDVPPVVDDVLEVVGDLPPVVDDVLEVVENVPPVVEILEDVPVVVEIVEDVLPVITDVVVAIPTQVTDVVVLPPFVPTAPASPGPIAPTVSVPTISNWPEVSHPVDLATDKSQPLDGLFNKELVAEMALFHLADLTTGSTANAPSASSPPEQKPQALAAYVPMAGTTPVVGGGGASSASGASHSGSNSFGGGLDAFSFFAAMAALLALCIVGWIRDGSRSGRRSIFPSHGGRPG